MKDTARVPIRKAPNSVGLLLLRRKMALWLRLSPIRAPPGIQRLLPYTIKALSSKVVQGMALTTPLVGTNNRVTSPCRGPWALQRILSLAVPPVIRVLRLTATWPVTNVLGSTAIAGVVGRLVITGGPLAQIVTQDVLPVTAISLVQHPSHIHSWNPEVVSNRLCYASLLYLT